jgi:hypothetical protein
VAIFSKNMNVYQIELLEPGAKSLLDELVKLNLIKFRPVVQPKQEFKALVKKIRSKQTELPTMEEVIAEVEAVRALRYGKK